MTKKLLIDAHQPEETRVALINHNRIEEFDYENSYQRQLKGNVYLARVTRVEPSLQAAFVEYGGNRQGFLAFSEIHPDYYRIPVEDREEIEAEEDGNDSSSDDEDDETNAANDENGKPEMLGGDDEIDQPRRSHRAYSRRYKIQEVIARKQILLVQVVKEERGNKGAALTTYLSLAGRYCVLMPNANRGGGVSRKIVNSADRKRLKVIVEDLDVPQGMAVIARTAGAKRTKTEIKRDYAYLTKLWDDIRTKTLESEAPSLIHEEGALVKKAIRDIYTNDIDEVLVEGEEAYKQAKSQMKMLIPSHAKKVAKYDGKPHLFQAHKVEEQLESIYNSEVTLKSGGYIVINQTEALVAIDVNSGKATKERNIEETAIKTNLEAAEEVGRQLKLRDLSGLIVIDFIDMEENRNQQAVERKLKDAVRNDRARIQVGSISHFGLLEMSRQRLRPSLVETVSQTCPHCEGTGRVRSLHSLALQMIRVLEMEAAKTKNASLTLTINDEIALYILNHKRESVADIEALYNISIIIAADKSLTNDVYLIDGQSRNANNQNNQHQQHHHNKQAQKQQRPQKQDDDSQKDTSATSPAEQGEGDSDDEKSEGGKKRRRGRRGGRRRKKRNQDGEIISPDAQLETAEAQGEDNTATDAPDSTASHEGETSSKRKRGRGRKPASDKAEGEANENLTQSAPAAETSSPDDEVKEKAPKAKADSGKKSAKKASKKAAKKAAKKGADTAEASSDGTPAPKEKAPLGDDDGKATKAPKAAKKAGKKAAKKAGKKAAKSASAQNVSDDAAVKTSTDETRAPISSAPVDVVEVGSDNGASKPKKGWWSR